MNNIKEFNANPLSRSDFWRTTGPVCAGITILALILISWERLRSAYVREKPYSFREKRGRDVEEGADAEPRPPGNSTSATVARDKSRLSSAYRECSTGDHNESDRQAPSMLQS